MKRLLLAFIFLLALILRTWSLGALPDAIDEDEMALGYYGFSLLNGGTDEYGNRLPIYFESIGDYKYGVYSYFATIPISILGLTPLSTRLPAALFGALSVIAIYYLSKEIFKNDKIALFSSLALAISPLHVHFSRVAYNNVTGLFFAVLYVLFFIRFLKKGELKNLSFGLISFVLAIFSYQAFRIFLPALTLLIFAFMFKEIPSKLRYKSALLVALTIVVVIVSLIPPQSRARTQDLGLLFSQGKIAEDIAEDGVAGRSLLETRAFHNKPLAIATGFVNRYFSYFDPIFLFTEGSASSERHTIPGVGMLYAIESLFIFLAILYFLKNKKDQSSWLPFLWIIAAPLAAAWVVEARSPTRFIPAVIGLAMLSGLGISVLTSLTKGRKWLLVVFIILYGANFYYVAHQYLVHKLYHHPWNSDVGLREMVEATTGKYYDSYARIVVSGGHYMPFLFYGRVKPSEFLAKAEIKPKSEAKWNRVSTYDKFIFNMPYSCPLAGKENTLYVCFGTNIPQGSKAVDVFRYKDGLPAIILVEFTKTPSKELPERVGFMKEESLEFPSGILPENYEHYWPVE